MQYQKQIQKDSTMYLIVTALNKYHPNQDVNNLRAYQYKNKYILILIFVLSNCCCSECGRQPLSEHCINKENIFKEPLQTLSMI